MAYVALPSVGVWPVAQALVGGDSQAAALGGRPVRRNVVRGVWLLARGLAALFL